METQGAVPPEQFPHQPTLGGVNTEDFGQLAKRVGIQPSQLDNRRRWLWNVGNRTACVGKVYHRADQVRVLEWVFVNYSKYPSRKFKRKLADLVKMKYNQLQIWFQTRRQRSTPALLEKNPITDHEKWRQTLKLVKNLICEETSYFEEKGLSGSFLQSPEQPNQESEIDGNSTPPPSVAPPSFSVPLSSTYQPVGITPSHPSPSVTNASSTSSPLSNSNSTPKQSPTPSKTFIEISPSAKPSPPHYSPTTLDKLPTLSARSKNFEMNDRKNLSFKNQVVSPPTTQSSLVSTFVSAYPSISEMSSIPFPFSTLSSKEMKRNESFHHHGYLFPQASPPPPPLSMSSTPKQPLPLLPSSFLSPDLQQTQALPLADYVYSTTTTTPPLSSPLEQYPHFNPTSVASLQEVGPTTTQRARSTSMVKNKLELKTHLFPSIPSTNISSGPRTSRSPGSVSPSPYIPRHSEGYYHSQRQMAVPPPRRMMDRRPPSLPPLREVFGQIPFQ
mmetsp:Transcript_10793/g.14439  ORF Transcript_10793/g.14439 Transcript_10793/m.14439 type:complete len:500 (-) Transcript_10793:131-1630(-)|eukprot:CAMPEP_0201480032 /NCGR_PEP_ID=MMETSP0151_2-20130828/4624_1 /ASSEMBLY_ACC=CAM_ASM_000257 /TAXON_ID=200890 /ORGANISM="Paramoeba atlantica, Strain 621/1 / CCAP 1560/9" /LENGTH=499 /DNA_ID=CAMNT_0047861779 /DNA_START=62 /DNA_END=1561 /DNA_ORIENTATION=+